MTANELRDALTRLKMTQTELAGELGVPLRTVQHWCRAEGSVPRTAAVLIRLMVQGRVKVSDLRA